MKRIRQTIEVAEPLWRALELMSRDMGVDRDALVAQALFQLARQNGYVAPTVMSLGGEAQGVGGAMTGSEPVLQAAAPVAARSAVEAPSVVAPPVAEPVATAVPLVSPGAGAQELVSAAAAVAGLAAAPAAPAVDTFSADDATEEPPTEPPGVTSVPLSAAQVPPTELLLARMQEILAEVDASVQPSEGLAAQSDDADDDESDDSDDEESDDADDDEPDDSDDEDSDDADDEESDEDSDEDSEDDASAADDSDEESASDDLESEESADGSDDEAEASAGSGVKGDLSSDDIAAELAALGVVEDPKEDARAEAPVATPIAARPLVARPVPKIRPPDEAATILEDQSAETTNIVKAPAPLEVFVQWAQGAPVAVSTERFTIGRGPRCSLVVKSERVSREHAVVTRVGDEVFIEDLNSSNGTWFNNERITRQQVSDGDEYMLGTEAVSFTMRPVGS
ncbi:FHA domain-containing protein [Myxococcus xanthus]|uniref:FHA domain-containing protein n=1 Tax=Myxococcus xanthus TaxID=34 RepID=A0AAE6KRQ9_MYXXA|nr:FHA domain-containing protein [Myxococcus xanthus]QDE67416.1 FHA domain-containing protein [Myxococcus xanthus]QDE74692.1 FHA domain-containing protein [Myxococcus xanthus]